MTYNIKFHNTNDEEAAAAVIAAKTMARSAITARDEQQGDDPRDNERPRRQQIEQDLIEAEERLTTAFQAQRVHAIITAALPAAKAEAAAVLLQYDEESRASITEENNSNSQGGIIHPTEHEKRRQVEQTLMDACSLFKIASNQLKIASEHYEEKARIAAAMDGGGSYLTYFMTSGMDVPRFTISSYLDNDSRINLLLTSKRMKDEFYANNNWDDDDDDDNNNDNSTSNNDVDMKVVRAIVISRTGNEGRVRDFFSDWSTNYGYIRNSGLSFPERCDRRLPFFKHLVIDNRNEINGYSICLESRRQMIEDDCPMKFTQYLDLSSQDSNDNVCANFPCKLSVLVPNIRHLNLSGTKYNNNMVRGQLGVMKSENEILKRYTQYCPRLEKITWNNNYNEETRNIYRDNKGCIQLNGYEMRRQLTRLKADHLKDIEFDDCLFVVDHTSMNLTPFDRVNIMDLYDPRHRVHYLNREVHAIAVLNAVNGIHMFHYCSNKLERVSIRNARYRYRYHFDGIEMTPFLPQEVLIKFVRNAPCLRYFRSNLTQENIAMLRREKPAIEFTS